MISRHHCVHRDGVDNEGERVEVDAKYVDEVREQITALVKNIETRFRTEITKVKPFDPFP